MGIHVGHWIHRRNRAVVGVVEGSTPKKQRAGDLDGGDLVIFGYSKIAATRIIVMIINGFSGTRRIISTVEITSFRRNGGGGDLFIDGRILALGWFYRSPISLFLFHLLLSARFPARDRFPVSRSLMSRMQNVHLFRYSVAFPFREWDTAR